MVEVITAVDESVTVADLVDLDVRELVGELTLVADFVFICSLPASGAAARVRCAGLRPPLAAAPEPGLTAA